MVSIPGKTFLVGEYAVLVGGDALGIATSPGFNLTDSKVDYHPHYHPHSAAGLFCAKQGFEFSQKIANPYGAGGFGQSTAEFIFAWLKKNKTLKRNQLPTIFNEYLSLFDSSVNQNQRPSGADLVTQVLGRIVHFKFPVQESSSHAWPFPELSFFVISTGLKIQTHEHLETLDREMLHALKPYSQQVIQSFLNKNSYEFIQNLKIWSSELEKMSLQHPDVLKIQSELLENKDITWVKPCGALGADVCLVFCNSIDKAKVRSFLTEHKFQIQATETDLSEGLFADEFQSLKDTL